ncbi:MAG: sulfite exporter TauE/SafE family protein [Alphaproteobacteria bacterium]
MGGLEPVFLAIFVLSAFAGSFVAGVAGFAFAPIAAGVWLHLMPPAQATTLIVAFGLVVQGMSVWRLRHAIQPRRLLPFVAGGALGVPAGVALLHLAAPDRLRHSVGIILILFSLYALTRPPLPPVRRGGALLDSAIGAANGVLGAMTGIAGIFVTVWSGLRGWPRDEQRAVFQPFGVAVFVMTAAWMGGTGLLDRHTLVLGAVGFPAILLGTMIGFRFYGRLGEEGFRRVVLALLLVSGTALALPALA